MPEENPPGVNPFPADCPDKSDYSFSTQTSRKHSVRTKGRMLVAVLEIICKETLKDALFSNNTIIIQ